MLDFFTVATRSKKPGYIEIYPKFQVKPTEDLMIRGGDFYAVWIEELGLWSTDEQDVIQLIDRELEKYTEEYRRNHNGTINTLYMWDSDSGIIDKWHKYC